MMFEVQALYKGDTQPVVLRTDDSDRAQIFAAALRGNSRYTEVFVIIGHKRFTHDEFLKQLESQT